MSTELLDERYRVQRDILTEFYFLYQEIQGQQHVIMIHYPTDSANALPEVHPFSSIRNFL